MKTEDLWRIYERRRKLCYWIYFHLRFDKYDPHMSRSNTRHYYDLYIKYRDLADNLSGWER